MSTTTTISGLSNSGNSAKKKFAVIDYPQDNTAEILAAYEKALSGKETRGSILIVLYPDGHEFVVSQNAENNIPLLVTALERIKYDIFSGEFHEHDEDPETPTSPKVS